MFCEVYLLDTPYHIDRPFDYSCEPGLARGSIVRVPFGRSGRTRLGVVVQLKDRCDVPEGVTLKSVSQTLSPVFTLTDEMLGMCRFLKEYTLCTFGEAVRTVLPPGAFSDNLNIRCRKTARLLVERETVATLLSTTGRSGIRSASFEIWSRRLRQKAKRRCLVKCHLKIFNGFPDIWQKPDVL